MPKRFSPSLKNLHKADMKKLLLISKRLFLPEQPLFLCPTLPPASLPVALLYCPCTLPPRPLIKQHHSHRFFASPAPIFHAVQTHSNQPANKCRSSALAPAKSRALTPLLYFNHLSTKYGTAIFAPACGVSPPTPRFFYVCLHFKELLSPPP